MDTQHTSTQIESSQPPAGVMPSSFLLIDIIEAFHSLDRHLVVLKPNTKKPTAKGWYKKTYTREQLIQGALNQHNLGWHLGSQYLVIDVDDKNGKDGKASHKKLINDYPELAGVEASGITPSGGYHIYCKIPDGHHLNVKASDYPGIDFKTGDRQYVLIAGCHVDGDYKLAEFAPSELFDLSGSGLILLKSESGKSESKQALDGTDSEFAKMVRLAPEQIIHLRDALTYIDVDDYDTWIDAGMALKNCGGAGYELWDKCSKESDKYDPDEQHKKWVKLFNELENLVLTKDLYSSQDFHINYLQELITFSHQHFADEEKILFKHDYPHAAAHRRMHKEFKDEVYGKYRAVMDGKVILDSELLLLIKKWFLNHTSTEDRKAFEYINNKLT